MIRAAILAVALSALAFAVYYTYFNPEYYDNFGGMLLHRVDLLNESTFTAYCIGGKHCVETQIRSTPGVVASAWRGDGSPIEYVYKRAVGLFEIPENVTSSRIIRFNNYIIWGSPIPHNWWLYRVVNHSRVVYGLQVAVKVGGGPVLTCLEKVPRIPPSVKYPSLGGLYNATCPGLNTSKVIIASVTWHVNYTGGRNLCVQWWVFWQPLWWYYWNYGYLWYGFILWGFLTPYRVQFYYVKCQPWPTPPRNITAEAGGGGVSFYVDGERVYWLNTTVWGGEEPWLYTGPYQLLSNPATAAAAVGVGNLPGRTTAYLGRVWLLIGNDTLAVPRYAVNFAWGEGILWGDAGSAGDLEAGVSFDGFSTSVGPGATSETKLVEHGYVEVTLHGERARIQNGTYFTCEAGEPVASGRVVRLGQGYLVAGPANLSCTHYVAVVREFNRSAQIVGVAGWRYVYTPRDVYLGNGTLLKAPPFEIVFNKPRFYMVNYTTYYRVVVKTPLGVNETWLPKGSPLLIPREIDFGNGTRLVLAGVKIGGEAAPPGFTVERPVAAEAEYRREHLVTLYTPWGVNKTWVREGASYAIALPEVWEPGNGTRFERLLINGTEARSFAVGRPLALYAAYGERYYWIVVRTPVNTTQGWFRPGAVITPPPVIELGNGTRLVDPNPQNVVVDTPTDVSVSYRRQYWMSISGVGEEWRGWAYEGSVIRLNETVIAGMRYTPSVPYVEVRGPAAVKVNYTASLYREFRDALGLPNPTASVELCGRRFTADAAGRLYATVETDRECQPKFEAWPLSPYTLAILAAVVAVAAALAAKRARR
jgi:hypothetical protein